MARTYQLRYIRCGKPRCHCARPGDPGHGPYWYGFQHRHGRVYSRYFGRRPASSVPPPPAADRVAEPRDDGRWAFRGRMDLRTALRILALRQPPRGRDELVGRWRALIWQHHPDRGGSAELAAASNAAYSCLKRSAG